MSKQNKGWIVGAFGWDGDGYAITPGENAFLGRLLERATELGGVGTLTKIKASTKGVSATSKSSVSYVRAEGEKANVDWRDGVLHAARAVADQQEAGLSGVVLDVSKLCEAWNKKQAGKAQPEPDKQ